ncbi:MAG: thioredoxin [Gammaproteobacteria bacterium]|nr:thioredoxin [Gammaproteobacteria bacterium]
MSDRLIAVVKRDCPTCELVEPVLAQLAEQAGLTVYSQDDPGFPAAVPQVIDDRDLAASHRMGIEIVPTLIRISGDEEVARQIGWHRGDWEALSGVDGLGAGLPEWGAGCGAINAEPAVLEKLKIKFGQTGIQSRLVDIGEAEDEAEAMFDRGWSDGLPLVPPTEQRVLRMLAGTTEDPRTVLGLCPPNLVALTVEKVAVNAVMAGCKPEYMPVVLASMRAALEDDFALHGVLATTMFVGPVLVVNGPVRHRIGMNAKGNALGQGNRANATIGRAIQLIVRNVGGGLPQGVDRACLGNPGKYTFCFAEDEEGSCWESLAVERGFTAGQSTVTVFAGYGVQGVVDQKARDPQSLCHSFAASLRAFHNVKIAPAGDAIVVVCPEHDRTFKEAGWSKQQFLQRLYALCEIPGEELVTGVGGIAEGIAQKLADRSFNKFRPGGLLAVRAGGGAGMFSAIIGGWLASGPKGSIPITKEVKS